MGLLYSLSFRYAVSDQSNNSANIKRMFHYVEHNNGVEIGAMRGTMRGTILNVMQRLQKKDNATRNTPFAF